jgi:hypothetical protein
VRVGGREGKRQQGRDAMNRLQSVCMYVCMYVYVYPPQVLQKAVSYIHLNELTEWVTVIYYDVYHCILYTVMYNLDRTYA